MKYLVLLALMSCGVNNSNRDSIIRKADCFCKNHNSFVLSIHFDGVLDRGDVICGNNAKVQISSIDYIMGCHE